MKGRKEGRKEGKDGLCYRDGKHLNVTTIIKLFPPFQKPAKFISHFFPFSNDWRFKTLSRLINNKLSTP